ncbi:peroxidase 43-like protein [Tanacetum coccineum]
MNNMLIVTCAMLISCCKILAISETRLRVGFYNETCPDAESIVNGFVRDAARFNNQIPAILLRLHFHDCFVQGCDGSILIDDDPISEKLAVGHQGVKGFDVIENSKSQLEFECPGVVSCADIVAIAARDAVAFTFGPFYEVETGRRDGFVSNLSLADNMPDFSDSIQLLKQKFFDKGLNEKDLVVLSGAHTIGTTACFFLMDRLYNFVSGGGPDPSIDPDFLPELTETCPPNGDTDFRLPIDHNSGDTFDNQILDNIRSGFAVLQSDAKLMDDPVTRKILDSYFGFSNQSVQPSFEADFVNSMIKMGRIGVKTSSERGEIRRVSSPGNTSSDPSKDLSKDLFASLSISPFHNDQYMKVMQAYNATSNKSPIPLLRTLIVPSPILPPSPVLSPSPPFDPRDFFLPEEILPPQKQARFLSPFFTDSSTPPQREQIRHDDEIVLARIRISTLEMLIEDIQYPVTTYGSSQPPGFLKPLYPDMINAQDIEHMIPPTPPRDTEPPVGSPISLSPSSSVGSSSPIRLTTPPLDYPLDESIFSELDNTLWIIPRSLESEPVPEEPNKSDAC